MIHFLYESQKERKTERMKTIALVSQKGGVGKTTLALHLAVGWQQAGQNVAVIDLDPQASAANWGDRREEKLPVVRSAQASRLEQELRAVEEAGGEIVILDTAPHSDAVILRVAKAAALVVIPCRPSILDLEALAGTLELVSMTGVPVLTVLNSIIPNVADSDRAEEAIEKLGAAICPIRISRRVAFSRALISGLTAQEYEPQGKAAEEIQALFRLIAEQVSGLEQQEPQAAHETAGGFNG